MHPRTYILALAVVLSSLVATGVAHADRKQYRFVVDFRPASALHEFKPGDEASRDIPERTQLMELQGLSA